MGVQGRLRRSQSIIDGFKSISGVLQGVKGVSEGFRGFIGIIHGDSRDFGNHEV